MSGEVLIQRNEVEYLRELRLLDTATMALTMAALSAEIAAVRRPG